MRKSSMMALTLLVVLTMCLAANAQGATFEGTWDTSFGTLTLSISGNMVTGNYTHDDGRITGTVSPDGRTLTGTWSEAPSYQPPNDAGDVIFTLSPDGKSFTGSWWYGTQSGGGSAWNGTRTSPPPAPVSEEKMTIVAYLDETCTTIGGSLTLLGSKRATDFSAMMSSPWRACSVNAPIDTIGFMIVDSNDTVYYHYMQYKNGGYQELEGSLNSLTLGPGAYKVYVQGGLNTKVTLTFTVSP
jgi:hypothetical protein